VKKTIQYLLLFLVIAPFYAQTIPSYYNGLDLTKTGNDLFLELSGRLVSTHSAIPYTSSSTDVWDACRLADEDPDIAANVLLIYGFDDNDGIANTDKTREKDLQDTGGTTGTWNREHVFAKSLAIPSLSDGEPGPGTDVHNIRPADTQRNSERSNRKFTDGTGDSKVISTDGGWYPGDEWKGDVARIVMYMYTRYHGNGTQVSETKCLPINVGVGPTLTVDPNMIELFLNWSVEDPVSEFEANRNEVLAGIQMNRNPFIDNPYLATLIWGGLDAEDLWWSTGSSDIIAPSIPQNLIASNVDIKSFDVSWDASTDDDTGVYDYLVYVDGIYKQSTTATTTTIANLSPDTSYNITVKARDAASNYSEFSTMLPVTTLVGPKILFEEYFEVCASLKFTTYSEISSLDWTCSVLNGENNSGSIAMNGYENGAVPSKDWLITKTPINFVDETGAKLRFYADATYGIDPLELLYSSDYDGSSNPSEFNWEEVPNVPSLIHDNTSTEKVYSIADADISAITGTVYFAFKYYSNSSPTRWTVDSFEISADNDNPDLDGDGVLNEDDLCSNTPSGETVDLNGCSNGQLDDDNDGVQNSDDLCASTPSGEQVNATGCSESQIDDDGDGVMNNVDICSNTPSGETVDLNGCSNGQLDDDNDGVQNSDDLCASTPSGEQVNATGCSESQIDDDGDGVMNNVDICSNTPSGETVDLNGCSNGQLDDDNDGVQNSDDLCASTPSGEQVNATGCSESQIDDDGDGVMNNVDICSNTPSGETVDLNGCSNGQLDDDNDGVQNSDDLCASTPSGEQVNATGCSESQIDDDGDGVMNNVDTCSDTPIGEIVDDKGCSASQLDDDNDGVMNDKDQCENTPIGTNVDAAGCFVLASNNFKIETVGETCPEKANGKLVITALETNSYKATINGTLYTFTDILTVENLAPKTYDFCILVEGQTYQQCYATTIEAGKTVGGKASVTSNKLVIDITEGTAPFNVLVNGTAIFQTMNSSFSIDVVYGDLIQVKTNVECEGVFAKEIDLFESITAYPNPTKGIFEIGLPFAKKEVIIELYNMQSQLISSKTYAVNYGKAQLNIEELPTGLYLVKVLLNKPVTFKIVKQ